MTKTRIVFAGPPAVQIATGQTLRKNDWLVGQHLRTNLKAEYDQLLIDAKSAEVTKAAVAMGLTPNYD